MLKRIALVAGVIALLVPVLIGVWLWGYDSRPVAAQTTEPKAYNPAQTITVVGQGSVRVQPDIAQISIGVETVAETAAEAVQENETEMQAILDALKKAGIADKEIQTMNYSLYLERQPETTADPSGKEGEKVQYHVSNMVNVTIRDLETVGGVLDAVIQAGANNIWGVSFSLEDPKPAQADARAQAIADAQARAQALAALTGVELGPVMSVSEVIGGGGIVRVLPVAMEHAAAGGGAVSPGELEISYQVEVAYFISPLSPGLPNPASSFCENQGYKIEIRTAADGSQTGYCIFPDGTECEEWAFFRGECKPGTPGP